jgi:hypothetical protein
MSEDRARLGVDGNAGFALLGANIQEGECEFEEVKTDAPIGSRDYANAERRAVKIAFDRLQKRLGRQLSYYLDPSYPHYSGA